MASTTNFNWSTPDDTSLVKDGAAAIRTLGQSIDTSMAELKGGTTGQVLSKTSNTDMDFTWVAQDDSNAIQNAIVDAKGDLIAATANDTPARLAVGANGETLVADSSTSTGLRYTAGTVQSNPILNSAMQCWQRGTSISIAASSAAYTADRWYVPTNASQAVTVSRQATGDTTNLPFIQYAMRVQRNSGQTGTGGLYANQFLESINSIPFAGKTVTLSFYAKAGANYSSASSVLEAYIQTGTGTDQGAGVWTGQATAGSSSVTLTTTWQRFSISGTIASTATQIKVIAGYAPTGTASTNDWFDITGVQLDIGSVALPFRTYAGTIQGELAACQYYFESIGGTQDQSFGSGFAYSTTGVAAMIKYSQQKRTVPTISIGAGSVSDFACYDAGASLRVASAISFQSPSVFATRALVTTSSMTAAQGTELRTAAANSTGRIWISAEL